MTTMSATSSVNAIIMYSHLYGHKPNGKMEVNLLILCTCMGACVGVFAYGRPQDAFDCCRVVVLVLVLVVLVLVVLVVVLLLLLLEPGLVTGSISAATTAGVAMTTTSVVCTAE